MNYYTSDTHFHHKKIREFCPSRPGVDTATMNEEIVRIWNETVSPEDTVFHLGDFSFGKSEETKALIKRLNGHKVLVMGNHDRRSAQWYKDAGFGFVSDGHLSGAIGNKLVVLSHYPFKLRWWERVWYALTDRGYTRFQDKKVERADCIALLHGHCHGKYYKQKGNAIDVGWDAWGKPVSEDKIKEML
jgi:calcineurin-like phosphoesterase family protein